MVNNLAAVAQLKQAAYAAARHDYTEVCLREFNQWQRELKAVRRQLFGILTAHWQSCPLPSAAAPRAAADGDQRPLAVSDPCHVVADLETVDPP